MGSLVSPVAEAESFPIMTMLLSLIVTGALIVNKAAAASVTDHAGRLQEIQEFAVPLQERMEKKSFASFRFRPKGLKDLETHEDAYKVMEELNHFTQRRGHVGQHAQSIPQYEGKTRARNLLEKAWMRALLKSNFGDRSGPAFQVSANLWK